MTDEGAIDFAAASRLATHLVERGCDGIVVSGTTGEAPTTHAPEKVDLILAAKEAVAGKATIVAGAGSNDTAHAVRMAEQAAEAGADGLLVVVPYYSKPSQKGVIAHFQAVADATDLPIVVYDIPGRVGIRLAPATLDSLAEIDTIVAVKDATGDVAAAERSIARTGMAWYSGDDALNLALLKVGAAGIVSVVAHVSADRYRAMISAFDAGDLGAADAIEKELEPVVEAIMGTGLGAVTAKAAMQAAGVIPTRAMRLPLLALDDTEYDALVAALTAAGVK
jgi:4-hydroxy-tetrahydrodipicolinate synthase